MEKAGASVAEQSFILESFANDATKLLPLFENRAERMKSLMEEARRSGVVLSEEDLAAAEDFGASWRKLSAQIRGVVQELSVALMGPIGGVIDRVREWTGANRELISVKIDDWASRLGQFIRDILDPSSDLRVRIDGLANSFKVWGDRISPLVDFLGGPMNAALVGLGAITLAPLVASLATLTAAFATLGVTLLATPIGWFLGAAALIGGAAYIVWRDWEALPQQFADMWSELGDAFGAVDGVVNRGAAWVDETFAGWYAATDSWLASFEARLWDGGVSFVQNLWDGMKSRWFALSAWVQGSFDGIKAKVVGLGSGVVDAIIEGISSQWERLRSFLIEKIAALTDFMPDWMASKLGFTAGIEQTITETTKNVSETAERTIVMPALAPEAAGQSVGDLSARVAPDVSNLSARVVNSASVAPAAPIPSLPDPARFGSASSPSTIETSTVSAGTVDVSSFEAPEPFVLHQPQTVNAPYHGGTVNIYEAYNPAAVRQQIEAHERKRANEHLANIRSALNN